MAYIGNTQQNQNYVPAIDYFSGDGSTTAFTLSRPVASVAAVQAVISNVPQNPGSAFTVSGNTITFTSAPPSGTNNIYVYYTSPNTSVATVSQNPVISGDTTTTGGFWSQGSANVGFTDGVVVDYTTGSGRVTVGATDGIGFYNGGTSSRTQIGYMSVDGYISSNNTFGFKNRIINGSGLIFQRGASTTTDSAYFVDRWYIAKVSSGTFTANQSSTAPAGFTTSISATVNTADGSIASNDEFSIRQHIEGYNISDLAWGTASAKYAAVSFWVRSSVTGTYPVAIRSSDSGITYVTTYTVNVADTFEYKSVTIPGPTTGTFGSTNNVGFTVIFGLGAGTDYQGTANTWNSGNKWFTSACTQWISTLGATFYITGIQLEKGSIATSFDNRSFGTELQLCQRYYQKSYDQGSGAVPVVNTVTGSVGGWYPSNCLIGVRLKVDMRTTPTVTTYRYDGTSGAIAGQSYASCPATVYQQGPSGFNVYATSNPGSDFYVNYQAVAEF